jgi:DNA-binding transcriptional ArsR family regulator
MFPPDPSRDLILIQTKVRRSARGCKDESVNGEGPVGGIDLQATIDALSSPVRREILWMLWDAELPAGEIAAGVEVTAGTVSTHLSALRRAGLVSQRVEGTYRYYRVVRPAMEAVLPLLASSDDKWHAADDLPERSHAAASLQQWVTVSTHVSLEQEDAFASFADGTSYSQWLGVPVTLEDGRFSTELEWGTRVRGRYEVVAPPELIAMRWDFDDEVTPVPGRQVVGYLRFFAEEGGCRVEVHQAAADAEQAEFLSVAWQMVLGRFTEYAESGAPSPREPRPKHRPTGA